MSLLSIKLRINRRYIYTPLQQQHKEFWMLLRAAPPSWLIPQWAAVLLSSSSKKRCKETVGECFTYTGTHSYLKDSPIYLSVVNYEVTETRRQTFLTSFCLPWQWGRLFLSFLSRLLPIPSLMSPNYFTPLFRWILYTLIGEPNTCCRKGN